MFGRRYFTLEWLRVMAHSLAMRRAVSSRYDGEKLSRELCATVASIRGRIPDPTPVTVVAIPHGAAGSNLDYFGAELDRASFWRALDCVKARGIRVLDHREFFSSLSGHYLPDHYHLDREGTDLWSRRILSDLGVKP